MYCNHFTDLDVYFEFVADNKSACAKKPDPKMLEYAKRDRGFEFNEWWVYIGDNYNKDILPMSALEEILLNQFNKKEIRDYTLQAIHVFDKLQQVRRYLESTCEFPRLK
ncbi:hypothetical protein RFI_03260 [Reticulomyxa filosa]|uniref:Uncharacterized protein n=1 Tax=Reticulomyxa filosa TaxID=46433 RepID=X6P882_RETFI|nr:hypothetical protein RFI_03260 [Reticulomyxa filosa]|eukprot:ETO33842.1 hypothetical protein RFI_03260 [Reticulomyxa filosa]